MAGGYSSTELSSLNPTNRKNQCDCADDMVRQAERDSGFRKPLGIDGADARPTRNDGRTGVCQHAIVANHQLSCGVTAENDGAVGI